MPTIASLIAFFATSFVLVAVPGPGVMFVVGRTLAEGRKAGILTVLFNSLGHFTWMLAVAFGLGELLKLYPAALNFVQIIGAVYLGYLGIQTIRSRGDRIQVNESITFTPLPKLAKEGYFVGFSNPKVVVFYIAVLPQFVNSAGNFTLQLLLLGLLFETMGITGDLLYSLLASAARDWIFAKSQRLSLIVASGGVLIVSLASFLLISSVNTDFIG